MTSGWVSKAAALHISKSRGTSRRWSSVPIAPSMMTTSFPANRVAMFILSRPSVGLRFGEQSNDYLEWGDGGARWVDAVLEEKQRGRRTIAS